MSAYLFLVAQQGGHQQVSNAQHARKKRSGDDDAKSISTGSTKSTKSSGTFNPQTHKKVFDINTSTYRQQSIMSDVDKKISKYEKKYNKLMQEYGHHEDNEFLSRYHIKNGDLMFSEKNLCLLRYSFFKNFEGNYAKVRVETRAKENGRYKLKYMRRLNEIKMREKNTVTGLPGLSIENLTIDDNNNGNQEDESEEYEDNSSDLESNITEFGSSLHKRYSIVSTSKTMSIQSLIKSNQFWNTIYQDLKFNLMEMSSAVNYIDLLPNLSQLIAFYREIIEYFLLNVSQLSCNMSNLREDERKRLDTYRFFYLQDFNYEWFKIMSSIHYKLFNNQHIISANSNLSTDPDSQEFCIHKQLIKRIISTIVENFRISINSRDENLYNLWEEFLTFIMFELIIKNYGEYNGLNPGYPDDLPEPTIGVSDQTFDTCTFDSSFDSKSIDSNSIDSPLRSPRARSNRNFSFGNSNNISTHTIDEDEEYNKKRDSLMIDAKRESIAGSNNRESIAISNKRESFIMEPQSPRYESYTPPTPLSSTFSITSTETAATDTTAVTERTTKLYNTPGNRKLIFSKFRKSKKPINV